MDIQVKFNNMDILSVLDELEKSKDKELNLTELLEFVHTLHNAKYYLRKNWRIIRSLQHQNYDDLENRRKSLDNYFMNQIKSKYALNSFQYLAHEAKRIINEYDPRLISKCENLKTESAKVSLELLQLSESVINSFAKSQQEVYTKLNDIIFIANSLDVERIMEVSI